MTITSAVISLPVIWNIFPEASDNLVATAVIVASQQHSLNYDYMLGRNALIPVGFDV